MIKASRDAQGEGVGVCLETTQSLSVGQLRQSGGAVAAAGAGVCSLKLQGHARGPSSLRSVICMINNLRYAQKHRSSSPDYGCPGKRPDDGFSRRV